MSLDFLRRYEPEQVRGSAAVPALSAPVGAPLSFCYQATPQPTEYEGGYDREATAKLDAGEPVAREQLP